MGCLKISLATRISSEQKLLDTITEQSDASALNGNESFVSNLLCAYKNINTVIFRRNILGCGESSI